MGTVVFWEQNVSKTAYWDLIRLGSRYGVPTQYVYPTVKVSDCWSLTLNVIHTVSALWILGGNGWKLRSCLIFLHLEICQGFHVVVYIKSSYKSFDIRDIAYEFKNVLWNSPLVLYSPKKFGILGDAKYACFKPIPAPTACYKLERRVVAILTRVHRRRLIGVYSADLQSSSSMRA